MKINLLKKIFLMFGLILLGSQFATASYDYCIPKTNKYQMILYSTVTDSRYPWPNYIRTTSRDSGTLTLKFKNCSTNMSSVKYDYDWQYSTLSILDQVINTVRVKLDTVKITGSITDSVACTLLPFEMEFGTYSLTKEQSRYCPMVAESYPMVNYTELTSSVVINNGYRLFNFHKSLNPPIYHETVLFGESGGGIRLTRSHTTWGSIGDPVPFDSVEIKLIEYNGQVLRADSLDSLWNIRNSLAAFRLSRVGTLTTNSDSILWTKPVNWKPINWTSPYIKYKLDNMLLTWSDSTLYLSFDGVNWSTKKFKTFINDAVWGNNQISVAMTDSSISISKDGLTWTNQKNQFESYRVLWAFDKYVTYPFYYGDQNGWKFHTSSDGQLWTSHAMSHYPIEVVDKTLIWSEGKNLSTSFDGDNWTRQAKGFTLGTEKLLGFIASSGSVYMMSDYYGLIYVSLDKSTWKRDINASTLGMDYKNAISLCWAKDRFFAINKTNIYFTQDVTNWSSMTFDNPGISTNIVWTGTRYVGVGNGAYFNSTDGISWVKRPMNVYNPRALQWTGKRLVLVDSSGIYTSIGEEPVAIDSRTAKNTGEVTLHQNSRHLYYQIPGNFIGSAYKITVYKADGSIYIEFPSKTWTGRESDINLNYFVSGNYLLELSFQNQKLTKGFSVAW